jgi:predicted secreted hydrolase
VRLRTLMIPVLLATAAVSAQETARWLRVTGPPELEFPRDHGAHLAYRTEWWYLTGIANGANGASYGFQITFFRRGLDSAPLSPGASHMRARQVLAAHLAIADIRRGRFAYAERLRRAGDGLAASSEADLDVWIDDWSMARADDGRITVMARDRGRGIGLALALTPERGIVLHGGEGYSQKGPEPGNASVYLSWPRLAVSGEIEVGGSRSPITGTAWFDHEWGTSTLGPGVVGWDWFGLRLDDGRDLMVFRLRRADGTIDPRTSGTVVTADGTTSKLTHDDVEIEALDTWTSAATGAVYPTRWRLRDPAAHIDLEVWALLADCELDGTATTGVVYWEGPVAVAGSQSGEGYVELTGYASSLERRF